MKKKVLITGAGGLIGSEAVSFFCEKGWDVVGIDNNMRQYFFGESGSVAGAITRLTEQYSSFTHVSIDIRDATCVAEVFSTATFDLIIHAAAQPSHDWAAGDPITDFDVNARGTLLLLEHTRKFSPSAVFIFLSTNKVYGDRPNTLPFVELDSRYDLPADHPLFNGIPETMSIDASKHSLFGTSKLSADVMVQEYGHYFGMKTAVFRGGCLSGTRQAGVELHGFLSYLVKCIVQGRPYTVFGYKGKQVRDNIHSYDVVNALYHFYQNPGCAKVYNLGGSRYSHCSVCEAIAMIESIAEKKANVRVVDETRLGDHQWYVSDVRSFQNDYPAWQYTYSLERLLLEMCDNARSTL